MICFEFSRISTSMTFSIVSPLKPNKLLVKFAVEQEWLGIILILSPIFISVSPFTLIFPTSSESESIVSSGCPHTLP